MRFADIPGHEDVKQRLREMVDSGRLPHALLLEGPSGAGKFALARAAAQYLHCTDRRGGDSCGQCPECRQHQSFNHIDTVFSFPVNKKKSRPTVSADYFDEFKTFLTENPYMDFRRWTPMLDNPNAQPQIYVEEGVELIRRLTFMTRRSARKVALVWLPEKMVNATANKLLKIIEEPFDDTVFIMTSDQPRLILPTIYSRVQRIEVPRYSDAELAVVLTAMGHAPAAVADAVAVAEGNVNEALRLLADPDRHRLFFTLFTELMRKAYGRRVSELRKWSLQVADLGREGAIQFIDYMGRMVRESFIMHLRDPRLQAAGADERAFMARFHPFINHRNVEDIMRQLDAARRQIAANVNAKIVFFDLAVRTIILIRR